MTWLAGKKNDGQFIQKKNGMDQLKYLVKKLWHRSFKTACIDNVHTEG